MFNILPKSTSGHDHIQSHSPPINFLSIQLMVIFPPTSQSSKWSYINNKPTKFLHVCLVSLSELQVISFLFYSVSSNCVILYRIRTKYYNQHNSLVFDFNALKTKTKDAC
jgi:hypothetical protein